MNPMMNNMNNFMNNIQLQQQQQMMQFQMQQQMQQQMLAAQQVQNQQQHLPITIGFRRDERDSEGKPLPLILVQCMPEDKVSDAIERYRNFSNDRDMKKSFIYKGFPLNASLTIGEAGIDNNSYIFVFDPKKLEGG